MKFIIMFEANKILLNSNDKLKSIQNLSFVITIFYTTKLVDKY